MYELRILSGLHRGATLPLEDQPHSIGASDEADVVITDDGISSNHAKLSSSESGWILTADEGHVFSEHSNKPQNVVDLAPGVFARLGHVWLTVAEHDAAWVSPPALPGDDDLSSVEEEAQPEFASAHADEKQEASPSVGSRGRHFAMLSLIVGTIVFSAAAAFAITSKSDLADKKAVAAGLKQPLSAEIGDDTLHDTAQGTAQEAAKPKTPAQLRVLFKKRLTEADLLKYFDMDLGDGEWTMQADLGEDDAARFDRLLHNFLKEYQVAFPVHAKIVGAESMLPFKIKQVITGANASIVTEDGQRMFVGEEFRGVRVVAIDDNHLVFAGKRKIEMNW